MGEKELFISTRVIRFVQILTFVQICSIFGPYIIGQIRTEQLFAYTNTLILISLYTYHFKRVPRFIVPLTLWIIFICISFISFFSERNDDALIFGRIDSLFLPISTLLFALAAVGLIGIHRFFGVFAWTTISLMSLNSLVAVFQGLKIIPINHLKNFWEPSEVIISTAEKSMTLARYSGIFNQPIEAGVAYSLAGLMLVAIAKKNYRLLVPLGILLLLGGFLTVSKAFIIVGLPVIIAYSLLTFGWKYLLNLLILVFVTLIGLAVSGWWGFFSIVSLAFGSRIGATTEVLFSSEKIQIIEPGQLTDETPIDLILNGRYTGATQQADVLKEGLGINSPDFDSTNGNLFTGIGVFAPERIYDSAWAFGAQFSGLIGIILIISILAWPAIYSVNTKNKQLITFSFSLSAILFVTSFGAPLLILNRASTISWLLIATISLFVRDLKKAPKNRITATSQVWLGS